MLESLSASAGPSRNEFQPICHRISVRSTTTPRQTLLRLKTKAKKKQTPTMFRVFDDNYVLVPGFESSLQTRVGAYVSQRKLNQPRSCAERTRTVYFALKYLGLRIG